MENKRSIIRNYWVPIGIVAITLGQVMTEHLLSRYNERKNLYDEVSKIADTNMERKQLYDELDKEIPLPKLTEKEMRTYLSNRQKDN